MNSCPTSHSLSRGVQQHILLPKSLLEKGPAPTGAWMSQDTTMAIGSNWFTWYELFIIFTLNFLLYPGSNLLIRTLVYSLFRYLLTRQILIRYPCTTVYIFHLLDVINRLQSRSQVLQPNSKNIVLAQVSATLYWL